MSTCILIKHRIGLLLISVQLNFRWPTIVVQKETYSVSKHTQVMYMEGKHKKGMLVSLNITILTRFSSCYPSP